LRHATRPNVRLAAQ